MSNTLALAAALFAFVVGSVLALLTIGAAWMFFRPMYGLLMLTCFAAGIYFIFFFGEGLDPDAQEHK